jgi:lipoate-protein ligase A
VSGFTEPYPEIIAPNPGGEDDPLGESVSDPALPWLRVFEPRDLRVVIGRHQDPFREVVVDSARVDGVPIHRRVAGGGAVVLAPGMVVVAARLARDHLGTTSYLERVNAALIPGIAAVCGVEPERHGLGDLALRSADGLRKVLGASLRQSGKQVVYLGCLLVADAAHLMGQYLLAPSREPAYRGGRDHRTFCGHLGALGATPEMLASSLRESCARLLLPHALP